MKKILIISAISIIMIVLFYGFFTLSIFDTSAKYTNYKEMNHYYESTELYISSNTLSNTNDKYNIINNYDFHDIEFEIKNSLETYKITNYDIDYDITCNIIGMENNNYTCTIDNTEKNIVSNKLINNGICQEEENLNYSECEEKEYTYKLTETKNKHKFKITRNILDDTKKLEVEIILKTTSPYAKQLKAIYVLNFGEKKDTIYIDNPIDYNSFCEYTINNNYDINKIVKLNIDKTKLIFDNTDQIYDNKINYTINDDNIIDSITIDIESQKTKKIKLYKKDFNNDCNLNDLQYTIID